MTKTPEEKKAAKAEYDRNRWKDPVFRAVEKTYRQERNSRPEVKTRRNAKARERNSRPEVIAARKAFDLARRACPIYCAAENKYSREYMRERRKDPEFRAAQNARTTLYRQTNRIEYLAHRRSTRALKQDRLTQLKVGKPCHDCGNTFHPVCMDWDHLPGEKKLFCVSKSATRKWDEILTEISKCQLVCANCHRVRTLVTRK